MRRRWGWALTCITFEMLTNAFIGDFLVIQIGKELSVLLSCQIRDRVRDRVRVRW